MGISATEIARRLRVSDSVIRRLLKWFQASGSTDESPRSGRPRCTTWRQDLPMQVTVLRWRTTNASRLITELRRAANINVSMQTIRNHLHEFNLHSRAAAISMPLTQVHRKACRMWSRLHLRWTRQHWGQVLLTDESRYCLSSNDTRERIWRRPGERFAAACVRQHDCHGVG